MNILQELFKFQDLKYRDFSAKLIPNVNKEDIIGVRIPKIREIAKNVSYDNAIKFLNELPHKYQEENILHGCLMNKYIKDLDIYLNYLDIFLPYINNWAVCDMESPKIFKKDLPKVHKYLLNLLKSKETYTLRFAIVSLLQFYLDNNFDPKDLTRLSKIKSNEYYVNISIAWYYSFALIKQYDKTICLFENNILSKWIHNKAIQKAIESYRISSDKKIYLKKLKIK